MKLNESRGMRERLYVKNSWSRDLFSVRLTDIAMEFALKGEAKSLLTPKTVSAAAHGRKNERRSQRLLLSFVSFLFGGHLGCRDDLVLFVGRYWFVMAEVHCV